MCQDATTSSVHSGDVNLEHSRIFIFVDKVGLVGHQHAVEGRLKQGQLFTDGQQGTLVFDMKSFDADTPTARKYLALEGETDDATKKKVNENMLGIEILNVNQYPEASFTKAKLVPVGKNSGRGLPEYMLEGDFTLHKVTKRIQIRCDMEIKEGWQHLRGAFKILQSEYGIKPFRKMLGSIGVKDELVIVGDLWIAP
jgi:polyisoprenoid-binding protein YceI